MRLWIRDTNEALPLSHRVWKPMLWLAQAVDAWTLAGTTRPRWVPPEVPWNGTYLCSDNPIMTAADCHALANALELASTMIPRDKREAAETASIPLDLRTIDQEDRAGGGPYYARPFKLFQAARDLRERIPELVAFLRRVPLPDGELVIHSPEVTLRMGLPVGPP